MQHKRKYFYLILNLVFVLFFSCTQNTQESKHQICLQKIDSLWLSHQQLRNEFVFNMDVFKERKEEMQQVLTQCRFLDEKKLTEELKREISEYNSILAIYKAIGNQYKECVLEGEQLFVEVKGLETEVKKGHFDNDTKEFVSEYSSLTEELKKATAETTEITSKLKAVEPAYNRISAKITSLVEE